MKQSSTLCLYKTLSGAGSQRKLSFMRSVTVTKSIRRRCVGSAIFWRCLQMFRLTYPKLLQRHLSYLIGLNIWQNDIEPADLGLEPACKLLSYALTAAIIGKVLPKPHGPLGGADLRFSSPQPNTSLHCETMDTVRRVVCLFTPQPYCLVTEAHGCK